MTETYLLLGCNNGPCRENLEKACRLIEFRCGKISQRSSVYETEAWGLKDQPAFLNMAVAVLTGLAPENLLTAIKSIEKEVGRTTTIPWGPREIDIDILLFGNRHISLPHLQIPHLRLAERRFSLVPLCEIAPAARHPVLQKTMSELLKECTDDSRVLRLGNSL